MKFLIPVTLFLISGIGGTNGQLARLGTGQAPEQRPARIHASWTVFVHPQYQYALPIPPGVRSIGHPEDLPETTFESADGNFLMSAWGGAFDGQPAEVIADQWDLAVRKGGRNINYQRRGSTWFVVSGTDREGIEYYEKFTMRGRHAAFVSIQFPRERLYQFERWVEEIEDGFGVVSLRAGAPAKAPQVGAGGNTRGAEGSTTKVREKAPRVEPPGRTASREADDRPDAGGSDDASTPTDPEKSSRAASPPVAKDGPVARKVDGKPGFVYSPFHPDHRLVDVAGIPSGKKVKCPYTMKIFRVP